METGNPQNSQVELFHPFRRACLNESRIVNRSSNNSMYNPIHSIMLITAIRSYNGGEYVHPTLHACRQNAGSWSGQNRFRRPTVHTRKNTYTIGDRHVYQSAWSVPRAGESHAEVNVNGCEVLDYQAWSLFLKCQRSMPANFRFNFANKLVNTAGLTALPPCKLLLYVNVPY